MKDVKYISASAGSGKTHTLTQILTDAVKNKFVKPENVILTTYTKAASAEFKEKAKAMFYENGLLEEADRLDQALIGTIHSVAESLIIKYWYVLGISPKLNIITEENQQTFMAQSLVDLLEEDDQTFLNDFVKEFSLPDSEFWKTDLNKIFEYATSYTIKDFKNSINYSKDVTKKFLHGKHHIKVNKEALRSLLDKAEIANNAAESDEQEELRVEINNQRRNLETSNPSSLLYAQEVLEFLNRIDFDETNDDKDEIINELSDLYATEEVHCLVNDYIGLIFKLAEKRSRQYEEFKKENHLIDYSDMEKMFYELLQNDEVVADIKATYKYVFVDEFQDCSPIQVKIFDRLSEITDNSIWVGDKKQAIYGFRGSDTELTTSVMDIVKDNESKGLDGCSTKILENSWRSAPDIVNFTNAVFEKVFNKVTDEEKKDVHLEPVRTEEGEVGFWWLTENNAKDRAKNIAANIVELINKGEKPKDIAVLAKNNDHLKDVANALREFNVPVFIAEDSLSGADTVRLVIAILQLIEDERSEYPKAHIAFLTEPDYKIEKVIDDKLEFNSNHEKGDLFYDDIPLVKKVLEIRDDYKLQSISAMVQGLIVELDLYNVAKKLNDVADSTKILHAIINAAPDYEDYCVQMHIPSSVTGFIDYIKTHDISVSGATEGVQFFTYHRSKGLEWKTVIVLGCEYNFLDEHRMLQREYFGTHFIRTKAPSKEELFPEVVISVLPNIFGRCKATPEWLLPIQNTDRYTAIKERMIEEMKRLFYVAMTRPRDKLILALNGKGKNPKPLDSFTKMGFNFTCDYSKASCDLFNAGVFADRLPNADINIKYGREKEKDTIVKLAGTPAKNPLDRNLSPSGIEGDKITVNPIDCGTPITVIKNDNYDPAALGTCIHDIFCVADHKNDAQIADMVKAYGFESNLPKAGEIKTSWEALKDWLTQNYGPTQCEHHELPFKHQLKNGQIVSGSMDYVWETSEGCVLVDYKTSPCTRENLINKDSDVHAGKYKGQLECYEKALVAAGKKVLAKLLYYPVVGVLVKI